MFLSLTASQVCFLGSLFSSGFTVVNGDGIIVVYCRPGCGVAVLGNLGYFGPLCLMEGYCSRTQALGLQCSVTGLQCHTVSSRTSRLINHPSVHDSAPGTNAG